jgi:hypothetical protein
LQLYSFKHSKHSLNKKSKVINQGGESQPELHQIDSFEIIAGKYRLHKYASYFGGWMETGKAK